MIVDLRTCAEFFVLNRKVVLQGDGGGVTTPGWAGGRPYANAHLVLEPNERVVDAKFQQLATVAELATWGYRVRPPRLVLIGLGLG